MFRVTIKMYKIHALLLALAFSLSLGVVRLSPNTRCLDPASPIKSHVEGSIPPTMGKQRLSMPNEP